MPIQSHSMCGFSVSQCGVVSHSLTVYVWFLTVSQCGCGFSQSHSMGVVSHSLKVWVSFLSLMVWVWFITLSRSVGVVSHIVSWCGCGFPHCLTVCMWFLSHHSSHPNLFTCYTVVHNRNTLCTKIIIETKICIQNFGTLIRDRTIFQWL